MPYIVNPTNRYLEILQKRNVILYPGHVSEDPLYSLIYSAEDIGQLSLKDVIEFNRIHQVFTGINYPEFTSFDEWFFESVGWRADRLRPAGLEAKLNGLGENFSFVWFFVPKENPKRLPGSVSFEKWLYDRKFYFFYNRKQRR